MIKNNRFICLYSGGTDSPVACYLAIKKGMQPLVLHFHFMDLYPLTDEKFKYKALEGVKELNKFLNNPIKIYLIPHGNSIAEYMKNCSREKLLCVFCRRMMYRIAEVIAEQENTNIIITGESLGEKASQTPINLRVIESVLKHSTVFRPLICFEKLEVEEIAKKIGTYESSIKQKVCCSSVPQYPETKARLHQIEEEESKLNIEKLIEESISKAEIFQS
ncbi:MAG: hypothetical protein EAX96_00525 [Candidatus Lokiarchaeota archaeon]|nr:hypothetical protein [Candidatus Lokiarchaeota archaeon]